MRFVLLITLLTSLITFDPLPKFPWQDDAKKVERAQELLQQTRAALGSDKVKSLSIVGTHRQKLGENKTSSNFELELLLPDKFFKSSVISPIANIINHANRTNFIGVQTSPFFGQAIAAMPGRRIETGMRFSF